MHHAALHASHACMLRTASLVRVPHASTSASASAGGGCAWFQRASRDRSIQATACRASSADASNAAAAAAAQQQQSCDSPPLPLPRVLIIAGPTGVGKTALSLRVALALGGEIVSADSIQVYRGLDVGSSKPSESERLGIVHHLLDIVHPEQEFGAGEFYTHATAAIDHIVRRGKVPIVVGGTGLYLRWLIGGKPPTPPSDPAAAAAAKAAVRAAAEAEISAATTAVAMTCSGEERDRLLASSGASTGWRGAVQLLAASGDPDTAARLAENDWYRMERAVEIVMSTGRPVGAFKPAPPPPYDFRCVMLTMPRVPLYR